MFCSHSNCVYFALSVGGCDQLQRCWDLYQSAEDALGVRDNFDPTRPNRLTPEEQRNKCLVLRTFTMCIHNVTRNRGCLGDLSFHSAKRGFEKQMKQFNCSNKGPVFEPSSRPTGGRHHSTVCSYRGHANAVHKHCGLFGDPHLRTFTDEFQTCKVQGAWPLIDNQHLTVQVTNDPVGFGDDPRATATSKVKYHQYYEHVFSIFWVRSSFWVRLSQMSITCIGKTQI